MLKGNFWKRLYDCGGSETKGFSVVLGRGKNKGRNHYFTGRKYHTQLVKSDANYNRKKLNKFIDKEITKEVFEMKKEERKNESGDPPIHIGGGSGK